MLVQKNNPKDDDNNDDDDNDNVDGREIYICCLKKNDI